MKSKALPQIFLKVGFTIVLLGYFLAWLPHRAVGLSFIGLEMGEWTKFLPKVQQGQYLADRILFYIPPITLSLMLVFWTIDWPNNHWKTWMMRGIAILISLLASPPIESIRYESTDQWLVRLFLVSVVVLAVLLMPLAGKLAQDRKEMIKWSTIAVLGLLGSLLPLWTYLSYRPEISSIFGSDFGIGPGLWLNTVGNLMVVAVGGINFYSIYRQRSGESIAA